MTVQEGANEYMIDCIVVKERWIGNGPIVPLIIDIGTNLLVNMLRIFGNYKIRLYVWSYI